MVRLVLLPTQTLVFPLIVAVGLGRTVTVALWPVILVGQVTDAKYPTRNSSYVVVVVKFPVSIEAVPFTIGTENTCPFTR